MTVELIPHTKRRRMSRARAARIFLRENGRCYVCGIKLRIGVDKYQIEHPEALSLGGSDDDAALRVICNDCHKPKTAIDAKAKAKRDRLVTASWQPEGGRRSRFQSAGFRRAPPHPGEATRPIVRKSDRHPEREPS